MGEGDNRIVFADIDGTALFETIGPGIPRVGDSIDLLDVNLSGIVEHVTWQIAEYNSGSRAIIHMRLHAPKAPPAGS